MVLQVLHKLQVVFVLQVAFKCLHLPECLVCHHQVACPLCLEQFLVARTLCGPQCLAQACRSLLLALACHPLQEQGLLEQPQADLVPPPLPCQALPAAPWPGPPV